MASPLPVDLGHQRLIRASSPAQVRFRRTDNDDCSSDIKAESSTSVKAEAVKAEPIKEEDTGQENSPASTWDR